MSLIPLALPPGISRDGPEYSSKGRYFDAWHTRWTDNGTVKPTGGAASANRGPYNGGNYYGYGGQGGPPFAGGGSGANGIIVLVGSP